MPKIVIAGLGPWEKGFVAEKAAQAMKTTFTVFRTMKHPAAAAAECPKGSVALDGLYEGAGDFAALNAAIAGEVMRLADAHGSVVYAVPGSGLMGEGSVGALLGAAGGLHDVSFLPGVDESALFAGRCACHTGEAAEACTVLPAAAFVSGRRPDKSLPLIVTQLDSALAAGEVKLKLMELYGDGAEALFASRSGLREIPLAELDRQGGWDGRAMVLLRPAAAGAARYDFDDLVSVMDRLRGPGGCPWDREQTHASLRQYLLEECYEVIEAVDRDNMDELCEELGDVLLQVVFHARLAGERGDFTILDVSDAICRKMISRHPHIFGDVTADTPEQVLKNWEAIKKAEKGGKTETERMMSVPRALPAILRSAKVQAKAAHVGFDWPDVWGAFQKLEEEVGELREEIRRGAAEEKLADEFGDVLFAAVNVARFLQVNPEFALNGTVEKFIRRFNHVESRAKGEGRRLESMTLREMDAFWDEAKEKE